MEIIDNPSRTEWKRLTERNMADDPSVIQAVEAIAKEVAERGDEALRELALKFDKAHIEDLEVSQTEITAACKLVPEDVKQAIRTGAANIRRFHEAQMPKHVTVETMPGVTCIQRPVAIQNVGLYIPGGQAPLFSTVLMLAIPAKIAGCRNIILSTPQNGAGKISPEILFAAHECGIDRIFRVGGAQAICAMAMGTESIPHVNKIFGPGNRYVTAAKQLMTSRVAIDMPAGPSEVLVIADDTANPDFVAADMLSQAEHGPDSQAICVCTSAEIADQVRASLDKITKKLTRTDHIAKSMSHSRIIILPERDDIVDFTNEYAPEHLIVSTDCPWDIADRITAAGSIFIGNYSPESAGDYASGTNHTLPTNGWAHAYSGVNIDSFMRKITYQELTQDGLASLAPTIVTMAQAEGLDAHAMAVKVRVDKL